MKEPKREMDSSAFVILADFVPNVIQEIRYHSTYNFIGERIDGYEEPAALITLEAARALKSAGKELYVMGYQMKIFKELHVMGYQMKIFDAYRPARAVKHFVLWGLEDQDIRMKQYFYPDLEKEELFNAGYIAKQSSHSRGSTVDLTLLEMRTGREVDMGSPFDFFGEISHPDFRGITEEQYANRMLLRSVMMRNGFLPFPFEWWHFTLENEPFTETYFDFPVCASSLRK